MVESAGYICSKKLRDSSAFKNVRIVSDRTPRQNRYYNKIKQTLNERKAAGETNIYIKYFNDIPKIFKPKNPLN